MGGCQWGEGEGFKFKFRFKWGGSGPSGREGRSGLFYGVEFEGDDVGVDMI